MAVIELLQPHSLLMVHLHHLQWGTPISQLNLASALYHHLMNWQNCIIEYILFVVGGRSSIDLHFEDAFDVVVVTCDDFYSIVLGFSDCGLEGMGRS